MEFINNKLDELVKEEDEDLEKVLSKMYGKNVLKFTLIFPSFGVRHRYTTFAIFMVFLYTLVYHFYLLTNSVILLRSNFEKASVTFLYDLIFLFVLIFLYCMNYARKAFANTHRLLSRDLGHYHPNRIYDESVVRSLEANKNRELLQFLMLPGLVVTLAGGCLGVPYIKNRNNPLVYSDKGVNMNLPIPAWYPFPTHEGFGHIVALLGQAACAANLCTLLVLSEIIFYRLSQEVIFELKVLQFGVKTLFKRARKVYSGKYPQLVTLSTDISNSAYQECISRCFKDCIDHHQQIIELLRRFQSFLSWPVAVAYSFGTGCYSLTLVNILLAITNSNYEDVLLFIMLCVVVVLNMYLLTSLGEAIIAESKVLRDTVYTLNWYELNLPNRKLMLIFQAEVMNPLCLTGAGHVLLCMESFSNIMNTGYSFFNLVNANSNKLFSE